MSKIDPSTLICEEAIEYSIELWTWLAETGLNKRAWPGWYRFHTVPYSYCFLCEFNNTHIKPGDALCARCPVGNCSETPYVKWYDSKNVPDRQTYAKEFLEILKSLEV